MRVGEHAPAPEVITVNVPIQRPAGAFCRQPHFDQPQWTQLRQPASRTKPGWLHFGQSGPSRVAAVPGEARAAATQVPELFPSVRVHTHDSFASAPSKLVSPGAAPEASTQVEERFFDEP